MEMTPKLRRYYKGQVKWWAQRGRNDRLKNKSPQKQGDGWRVKAYLMGYNEKPAKMHLI
jgi:hypothetical protein